MQEKKADGTDLRIEIIFLIPVRCREQRIENY
jgi:hypothetical protein